MEVVAFEIESSLRSSVASFWDCMVESPTISLFSTMYSSQAAPPFSSSSAVGVYENALFLVYALFDMIPAFPTELEVP